MKSRSGFTLVELMVVVGIMILLATIVVSGSFGMSRASGYMAAENVVYNTLQAARQKACTDGKRVVVAFVKREEQNGDGDNFALITAEAVGTIDSRANNYITDRTPVLEAFSGMEGSDSVWNLRNGAHTSGSFTVLGPGRQETRRTLSIPGGGGRYTYEYSMIRGPSFSEAYWKKGDPYGFQIGEMQELPLGFKFGISSAGSSPEDKLIVFEPDGTSFLGKPDRDSIRTLGNEARIVVYEEIAKDKAITIVVRNGAISVRR